MTTPLQQFARDMAAEVRTWVLEQTAPLKARIALLEHENRALQALVEGLTENTKGAIRDKGLWRADQQYQAGDCTTWKGTAWIAVQPSLAHAPGQGDVGYWRCFVQRGRDGRDARGVA